MSVRKVKKTAYDDTATIEANRETARTADPSAMESNKVEGSEYQENTGASPGKVAVPGVMRNGRALVITLPSSSFAPVKYGSFAIPAVSMTVDPAHDDEPGELVESAIDFLQKLQQDLFEHELAVYVARAKRAHKQVQEALGED